ncbi:MAG: LytTR family DNA-binding domain-containing protein [Bacteroidota bacterium]
MPICLVVEDSRLARKELLHLLADIGLFDQILEAEDADMAQKLLAEEEPDVLFLDIHLPGQNGFELLESLDQIPHVIFTTAYDEYAIQAFEFNAIDYLLKPIKRERLEKAIQKLNLVVKKDQKIRTVQQQVFVKDGDRCWFVKLDEIRMFESVGNYSRVYFKSEKPLIHKSLNYLEKTLNGDMFFRVNRQQIINLQHVDSLDTWFSGKLKIRLKNGEEVEVSRRQSNRIKAMFSL